MGGVGERENGDVDNRSKGRKGARGKLKASRGSFMEQSIVHLFLSILLSSFLLSSFF